MENLIERSHVAQCHVEIIGQSQLGKTTLSEWLMTRIHQEEKVGMLLIDPTGDSYRKYLGWIAEGHLDGPLWLVDLDDKPLRYNPLQAAKKDPDAYVPGLFESLTLVHSEHSVPGQHRAMRRYVESTLHALIDNNMKLTQAEEWLNGTERSQSAIRKIRDKQVREIWGSNPSGNDLKSSKNWFDAFGRGPLVPMYSGDGFNWEEVYPTQALVLVNLNCRKLGNSTLWKRGLATMLLNGLYNEAFFSSTKYRWYVVVDDAQLYLPENVAQFLVEARHYDLFFQLIHHFPFEGGIQKYVDGGCRTKFYFGESLPSKYQMKPWGLGPVTQAQWGENSNDWPWHVQNRTIPSILPEHECLYVHQGEYTILRLRPTPEPESSPEDRAGVKARVYEHEWYGVKEPEAPKAEESRREPSAVKTRPVTPPPETPTSQTKDTPPPRASRTERARQKANRQNP